MKRKRTVKDDVTLAYIAPTDVKDVVEGRGGKFITVAARGRTGKFLEFQAKTGVDGVDMGGDAATIDLYSIPDEVHLKLRTDQIITLRCENSMWVVVHKG